MNISLSLSGIEGAREKLERARTSTPWLLTLPAEAAGP